MRVCAGCPGGRGWRGDGGQAGSEVGGELEMRLPDTTELSKMVPLSWASGCVQLGGTSSPSGIRVKGAGSSPWEGLEEREEESSQVLSGRAEVNSAFTL